MRLTIGLKIFSIAIFLATVMIVAALLSESRIRQAEIRIDVLADHLLPISDKTGELRSIALREEIRFQRLIGTIGMNDAAIAPDVKTNFAEYTADFNKKTSEIRTEIDAAIIKLSSIDTKLKLAQIKSRIDSLVDAHDHVERLIKRIETRHAEGKRQAEKELLSLFNAENAAFQAADATLTKDIRALVDSVAKEAESEQALAISFEHIVTGIAAILGLLLAGIMARALVEPIKNLRHAAVAVESGDLDQSITVNGKDELADLGGAFNAMVEQLRRKEKTEAMFGRYVDPRVVQKLIDESGRDADDIATAGRQEATIFFSDVAGYTSISERLTPGGLVNLMNEYFNLASGPIADSGGLLDKFIGDAVMAFWCPPFAAADDIGRLGCETALAEIAMVQEFQKKLPDITGLRKDIPDFKIRVGLATGEVVVGSIGSENKHNFTVIGDTVNLSSRLEGANKFYGTNILICERTRASIGTHFTVREIDNLAVAGKSEAIKIFELFGIGSPSSDITEAFEAFAAGLENYRRTDWEEASKCFNACLAAKPLDPPALTFLDRIEHLKTQPPMHDWDGVWRATNK